MAGQGYPPGSQTAGGSANTGSGSPAAPKKVLPFKKILMIAVPVVVLVVAAIIIIPMLGGSDSTTVSDHIRFYTYRGEIFISGNNNERFSIDGDLYSWQRSMDGSKAVMMVDYDPGNGGYLFFITPAGYTEIAADVFAYRLADSGNGLVYFTDYNSRDNTASLYLLDTSSKTETLIADDAHFTGSGMWGVSVSPNGKSVGYVTDYDDILNEFVGYIKIDGRNAEKLGEETYAVAISDSGRHIYYYKTDIDANDSSFHVRSGNNEFRLSPSNRSLSIMLNRDYSEVIFTDVEGRTFMSRNGSERARISGQSVQYILTARGTQVTSYANVVVYGLSSLSNFVGVTEDGLAFYNSQLESHTISTTRNFLGAEISSDGKTLYFLANNNRLSSIDPTIPNADRNEIARNVVSFTASTDGRSVYFVNEDKELHYVSGNSAPRRIADDVYHGYLAMSFSGSRLFFLVDYRDGRGGELNFSNNGGNRTRVAGADDVMWVTTTSTNAFFRTRLGEIFRSNGNETFTLFVDEID